MRWQTSITRRTRIEMKTEIFNVVALLGHICSLCYPRKHPGNRRFSARRPWPLAAIVREFYLVRLPLSFAERPRMCFACFSYKWLANQRMGQAGRSPTRKEHPAQISSILNNFKYYTNTTVFNSKLLPWLAFSSNRAVSLRRSWFSIVLPIFWPTINCNERLFLCAVRRGLHSRSCPRKCCTLPTADSDSRCFRSLTYLSWKSWWRLIKRKSGRYARQVLNGAWKGTFRSCQGRDTQCTRLTSGNVENLDQHQ